MLILFVVVVIALKFGAVPVSLYALGRDLLHVIFGQSRQISSDYGLIIIDIRLPRILLAIVVGASLSVAGTSFQALLRNPLADPYVLGISGGAACAAMVAIAAGAGSPPNRAGSIFGAIAACRCTFSASLRSTVPAAAPSMHCALGRRGGLTSRARFSRASMSRIWRAC